MILLLFWTSQENSYDAHTTRVDNFKDIYTEKGKIIIKRQ
jgi:hypothetical protein